MDDKATKNEYPGTFREALVEGARRGFMNYVPAALLVKFMGRIVRRLPT